MVDKTPVDEFAELKEVALLRAGRFFPKNKEGKVSVFHADELDAIAVAANECQPYLLSASEKGQYEGNDIDLQGKPIPGLVNLNHQEDLPETMREATKGITGTFYTKMIDGVKWLVADLKNVRNDVADFIKRKYAARSVEIVPFLYNPLTNKTYQRVIRSIGFLDRTMPPAVGGQRNDFVVAYSSQIPVLTFLCEEETTADQESFLLTSTQETQDMAEQETKNVVMPATPDEKSSAPGVSVEQFSELQQQIVELQNNLKAANAEADQTRKDAEKMRLELLAERKKAEKKEIEQFCRTHISQGIHAEAFNADFMRFAGSLGSQEVIEFSEKDGEPQKATQREYFLKWVSDLVDLAKANTLLVPTEEYAHAEFTAPKPATSNDEKRLQAIKEFMEQTSGDMSKAYDLAIDKYPTLFEQ